MHKSFYILTFLLTLILIQTNGQDSFVTDSTAKKLGIKTVTKKTFFGDEEMPSFTYTEIYNLNGQMTMLISFNNHFKEVIMRDYFYYNNVGQLIKMRRVDYDQNDSTEYITSYSYNSKGQLDENFFGEIEYKYDSLGRVIEKAEETVKESDFVTNYSYDSVGLLISIEKYLYNSLEHKTTFIYNSIRQVIKEIHTFYMPKSEHENTFLYNEKGLIITEFDKQTITSFSNKPDNRKYTYEYSFY